MTDSFNVFVIGPMGADKEKPSESGTPISQHMANIAASLRAIMPRYVKPPSIWEVFSPLEGVTDITEYVFTRIDDADLAVADITSRSPSVMYELAYFHALGTPIIVLDDSGRADDALPFYLKGTNVLRITAFDVESLTTALSERIHRFFDENEFQDFGANPITSFYGAPLMEISGASTIARGYYRNFVRGIIDSQSGIAAPNRGSDNPPVKKLYIIKPSGSLNISADMTLLEEAFGEKDEQVFNVGARKLSALYDDKAIFDLPRTVYTLAHSPRVQRLERAMGLMAGVSAEKKAEMRTRALSGLVTRFYDAIGERIAGDENVYNQMVEFIDVSDVSGTIQAP